MANEADVIELSGMNPIRYTCASGTAISKGALLKLSGDFTVAASAAVDVYAGVAAADKSVENGDTSTEIAVHVPGSNNIFDMTCSAGGGVTLGALVALSGANLIQDATTTEVEEGKVIGQALEAGEANEVIRVRS